MRMRNAVKVRSLGTLSVGVVLGSLLGSPAPVVAEGDMQSAHDAYVENIVTVLRSQVIGMRIILDNKDFRYSDNVVRHAEAVESTFGMVGPMEWHAADAFLQSQKDDATEKLTEKQFEELAENSREAMHQLKKSARRYMRDKNRERMHGAINRVIDSCGACHSKLPEGAVPHVWKGMKK